MMDLTKLRSPFDPRYLSWRIMRSGISSGKPWATIACYVDARAVQDRLDKVCGPAGWKQEFKKEGNGFLCGLSIFDPVSSQWVTKWDGSDETDVEAFKGGISKALVRAASAWGIARYLYDLGEGYAEFVDKNTPGAIYAKIEGQAYYWLPPQLPAWALPEGEAQTEPPIGSLITTAPESKPASVVTLTTQAQTESKQAHAGSDYVIPFGKFKGKKLSEIKESEIRGYIAWMEANAKSKGQAMDAKGQGLIAAVDSFYQPVAAPAPVAVGLSKAVEFVKQQEAVAEPGADMDDLPF
jgi:hypothetical protein